MKAKCLLCGKETEVSKLHKDYKKLLANPSAAFICDLCHQKVQKQAANENDLLRKKK